MNKHERKALQFHKRRHRADPNYYGSMQECLLHVLTDNLVRYLSRLSVVSETEAVFSFGMGIGSIAKAKAEGLLTEIEAEAFRAHLLLTMDKHWPEVLKELQERTYEQR